MSTTAITIVINDDQQGTIVIRRDNLSVMLPINVTTDDENPITALSTTVDEAIHKGFTELATLIENPPDTGTVAANPPASKPATTTKPATTATTKKAAPAKTTPPPPPPADFNLFEF